MNSDMPLNPFIYNAPVRGFDFFNRDEIMDLLLKETITGKSQGNVWITGVRQVGKTSLLRYIQSRYENFDRPAALYSGPEGQFHAAFIYLNVQDNKTRDEFYHTMQQSLKNYFDFKLENLEDPFDNFIHTLKHLYFERKYYILFLVDEFDAFVETLASNDPESATAFLAELNKLIQGVGQLKNEPKVFGCIFAANHTIEDLMKKDGIDRRGSGLVLESVELPTFEKHQIEELATHYLKDNSVQFGEKEIDFCFKMTQGYPYFVQKLFSLVYDQKAKTPGDTDYLKKVEKEYGAAFHETIKGWGGAGMPKRTLEKLKDLTGKLTKEAGGKLFNIAFKLIEEALKNAI